MQIELEIRVQGQRFENLEAVSDSAPSNPDGSMPKEVCFNLSIQAFENWKSL